MHWNFRNVFAAAAALIAFAAASLAQTSGTATVRGQVLDQSGAAVGAAEVRINSPSTSVVRTTRTDTEGRFTIAEVPLAGAYTLTVHRDGFADQHKGPFALRAGETAVFHVRLAPASVTAEVRVSGTTEGVRADSPQLSTRFDTMTIENTPVLGRKLTTLPLVNSSVRPARGTGDLFLNNTLFVIDGGGRRQTTYTIDGSTGDDEWGRQTIFTNVPLAAVQELTVLTNSFSAEYGRSTGGAVNVVTRAGTNEFHGDALYITRPGGLQAKAPVTGIEANDELQQGSLFLSGPAVPGRVFFSAGGEYSVQHRDSVITSPLAPGVYTGRYDPTLIFARVDVDLNTAHHAMGRVDYDSFEDTNPQDVVGGLNLPTAGRVFRRKTLAAQATETAVLSGSAYNDLRLQYQNGDPITEFEPVTPSSQFVRPGVSTEGESRSALLTSTQWHVADTVSFSSGNHYVKVGGEYISSRSGGNGQEFGAPFFLGQFTFRTGIPPTVPTSSLTIADVTRYQQGFGNVTYSTHENVWAAFVQDDFRPRSDLAVNLGLRYDLQTLTDATDNISPRVGFAWNPGGNAKTVLRGGYGRYYSEIRANIQATFALGGPTGFFTYTAAPGQLGFPTSLEPLPGFPPGASLPARDVTIRAGQASYYDQFFDTSKLHDYPDAFINPRTDQFTLGAEREILPTWFAGLDLVTAHTVHIDRNLDENAPAVFVRTQPGQTRSASAADATRPITPVANGYRRILVTVNTGEAKYDALQFNLHKSFANDASLLASYTWSHTRNNVEPDAPGGDPSDFFLQDQEWANSLLDQRHRFVLSGWSRIPWGLTAGGVMTWASGRPYNITTGADNNGDAAATSDRPVIDGAVVGRNAGEGSTIFDLSLFLARAFPIGGWASLELRAECFNVTNHLNVYGRNGVWGNATSGIPLPTFGQPLGGVANVEPGRMVQFQARLSF